MKSRKWKLLESRYIVNDKWLKLRKDKCLLPNGNIINDFYVSEYPNWANVLAITNEGLAVIISQYRHGRQKVIHELPGGIIEKDQTPLEAIQRELLEETGYESKHWIELGSVSVNPDNHTNLAFGFLALGAFKSASQNLDENECIDVELIDWNELLDMAKKGSLEQALHVTTVFRAMDYIL